MHCRLSNPDAPPRTQTDFSPVSAYYVSPSEKVKGSGVWSMFAIFRAVHCPNGPIHLRRFF